MIDLLYLTIHINENGSVAIIVSSFNSLILFKDNKRYLIGPLVIQTDYES